MSICQNPQMYNTKSELECKLWILISNNVLILAPHCNKCSPIIQDVNNRENCVWDVGGGIWELYFPIKYFCKRKTALKE